MNKSPLLVTIRHAFISGLILLAPLMITIWVFMQILAAIGGTFAPLLFSYLPDSVRNNAFFGILLEIVATVVILALITVLGYLSRYVFGQYFGSLAERFVQTIPGVNTVYNTVKQIVDTFSAQNRNMFSKVVLVEYPRKGVRTVGFMTNRAQGEIRSLLGAETCSVFVPTTPNPTSGFFLLFSKDEVIELDMSVGDGMKLVISAGAVVPAALGEAAPAPPPSGAPGA